MAGGGAAPDRAWCAGLSQAALADLIGSLPSFIADLDQPHLCPRAVPNVIGGPGADFIAALRLPSKSEHFR